MLKSRKYINYINYSCYSDYMVNSSIQISKDTKNLIASFGCKEDTYEEIIKKMYKMAVKEQLREFLMSSDNCISIDEAIKLSKKQWQK